LTKAASKFETHKPFALHDQDCRGVQRFGPSHRP